MNTKSMKESVKKLKKSPGKKRGKSDISALKKYLGYLKNKKVIVCAAVCAAVICIAIAACSRPSDNGIRLFAKGEEVECPAAVYTENGSAMVPLRAVCDAFGASIKWDDKTESMAVTLEPVTVRFTIGSDKMIKYGQPVDMGAAACFSGDYAMVPVRAIADAFGYPVEWDEKNKAVFLGDRVELNPNPMADTVVTDEFRHEQDMGTYNSISVFSNGSENFGMELLSLNDSSGAYADAVEKIARSVPDADVYNILAPSAQEFYAPNSRRTNQTAGITAVYDNLISRDIPNLNLINVVGTLSEHAAEKIYFCTDHHWTQRGAYYAYAEYSAENPNIDNPEPLQNYRTENRYGMMGSLSSFMSGTYGSELIAQNPDMLQLFYPNSEYEGAVYNDPFMNSYMQSVVPIYPWLNNYSCFLQGDYPLEVFRTNVNNGRKICIVKESFGDAFSVWALNNYEEVYIIDYRMWNGGTYGNYGSEAYAFKLKEFYDFVKFDDLVIISYPVSVTVKQQTELLAAMAT